MNLNPWGKESGGELLSLDGVLWLDVMQPGASIRSYVLQMAARLSSGQRYCSIPLSRLCEICLGRKVQPSKEGVCKRRAKFREILFHAAGSSSVEEFVGLPGAGTLESTRMPLLKQCPCWEGTGKKKRRNLFFVENIERNVIDKDDHIR